MPSAFHYVMCVSLILLECFKCADVLHERDGGKCVGYGAGLEPCYLHTFIPDVTCYSSICVQMRCMRSWITIAWVAQQGWNHA
jgi:hypothetical protein